MPDRSRTARLGPPQKHQPRGRNALGAPAAAARATRRAHPTAPPTRSPTNARRKRRTMRGAGEGEGTGGPRGPRTATSLLPNWGPVMLAAPRLPGPAAVGAGGLPWSAAGGGGGGGGRQGGNGGGGMAVAEWRSGASEPWAAPRLPGPHPGLNSLG